MMHPHKKYFKTVKELNQPLIKGKGFFVSVSFLLKQMGMIQEDGCIREVCQEGKRGMMPSVKDLSGFVDCLTIFT